MTKLLRFKIYFLVVVFQMARVKQTRYRPSERDLRRAICYFGGIDSRQVNQDSITASTDIENSSNNDTKDDDRSSSSLSRSTAHDDSVSLTDSGSSTHEEYDLNEVIIGLN